MTDRKWLPAEWMDESVPELAEDPAAFVTFDGDYGLRLRSIEHQRDGEENWTVRALKSGDVVDFMWHEGHGLAELHIHKDSDGNVIYRTTTEFPADTSNFALAWDWDTICSSLSDLVDLVVDEAAGESDIRRTIIGYTWSDAIPFRVTLLESGAIEVKEVGK